MLGLNDVNIAKRRVGTYRAPYQEKLPGHAKGDGAYVLARKPDFIIIGPSQGETIASPWFLSDLEISEDPQFWVHYELKQVSIDVSKIKRHKRYRLTNTGSFTFTFYQRSYKRT